MFCDEKGYDFFPFQMVRVLQHTEEKATKEDLGDKILTRVVQNEISSFDHSSTHKPEDDEYYNTAKEFEDAGFDEDQVQTHPPMALKTRHWKEIQLLDYPARKQEPRKKHQVISKGIYYKKKMLLFKGKMQS